MQWVLLLPRTWLREIGFLTNVSFSNSIKFYLSLKKKKNYGIPQICIIRLTKAKSIEKNMMANGQVTS